MADDLGECVQRSLRLAVAGELYAAAYEVLVAARSYGVLAPVAASLYAIDLALRVREMRPVPEGDGRDLSWGIDISDPGLSWAVDLAEARRDRDRKRTRRLLRKGSATFVLDWAATTIRHAHHGPRHPVLAKMLEQMAYAVHRDYVATPRVDRTPKPKLRPTYQPVAEPRPPGGFLGIGVTHNRRKDTAA